jgi:hypothetical protein
VTGRVLLKDSSCARPGFHGEKSVTALLSILVFALAAIWFGILLLWIAEAIWRQR